MANAQVSTTDPVLTGSYAAAPRVSAAAAVVCRSIVTAAVSRVSTAAPIATASYGAVARLGTVVAVVCRPASGVYLAKARASAVSLMMCRSTADAAPLPVPTPATLPVMPPAPQYSAADYLAALQDHLPTGRVWPRDADALQAAVLSGLAQSFWRSGLRAAQVLHDAFPGTTLELLPEWEATCGLPDACTGQLTTTDARRHKMVWRLTDGGGESPQHMIDIMAFLGFAITITEFSQFRVGESCCGDPLGGDDWPNTWQVNFEGYVYRTFRTGLSTVGMPLAEWRNRELECELRRLCPAHTILIFTYKPPMTDGHGNLTYPNGIPLTEDAI